MIATLCSILVSILGKSILKNWWLQEKKVLLKWQYPEQICDISKTQYTWFTGERVKRWLQNSLYVNTYKADILKLKFLLDKSRPMNKSKQMWTGGAVLFLEEEEFITRISSPGTWKIHVSIHNDGSFSEDTLTKNNPQKYKNQNQTYISEFAKVTHVKECLITEKVHHLASKYTHLQLLFQQLPFKAFIKHELYSRIEDQQQRGESTVP